MDGYEVCRALKQAPDPDVKRARVIVLSAYGEDQHRAKARAAGCELHLVKPVSPHTLFDVLESSRPS
jgi:CheY-like chemotaxis protein